MKLIDLTEPADDPQVVLGEMMKTAPDEVHIVAFKDGEMVIASSERDARITHFALSRGAAAILAIALGVLELGGDE